MYKVIAIGNTLMQDDGIAIKVAQNLNSLLIKDGFEIIIGETDTDYIMDNISNGDLLFFIDSTNLGIAAGSITITPLSEIISLNNNSSIHSFNCINAIKYYSLHVEGYIIGIEIQSLDFTNCLSSQLSMLFPHICKNVYKTIFKLIAHF